MDQSSKLNTFKRLCLDENHVMYFVFVILRLQPLTMVTVRASAKNGPDDIVPECVLWNGWVEKVKSMSDLQDSAWKNYVCVEPGLVASARSVSPGTALLVAVNTNQK